MLRPWVLRPRVEATEDVLVNLKRAQSGEQLGGVNVFFSSREREAQAGPASTGLQAFTFARPKLFSSATLWPPTYLFDAAATKVIGSLLWPVIDIAP